VKELFVFVIAYKRLNGPWQIEEDEGSLKLYDLELALIRIQDIRKRGDKAYLLLAVRDA
jgi:hypothetical protein